MERMLPEHRPDLDRVWSPVGFFSILLAVSVEARHGLHPGVSRCQLPQKFSQLGKTGKRSTIMFNSLAAFNGFVTAVNKVLLPNMFKPERGHKNC